GFVAATSPVPAGAGRATRACGSSRSSAPPAAKRANTPLRPGPCSSAAAALTCFTALHGPTTTRTVFWLVPEPMAAPLTVTPCDESRCCAVLHEPLDGLAHSISVGSFLPPVPCTNGSGYAPTIAGTWS